MGSRTSGKRKTAGRLFFVVVFCFGTAAAWAHTHGPTGTFTEWNWPAAPSNPDGRAGYRSFENRVTVQAEPPENVGYFWSHQFAFSDGEPGYLGLQTLGRHPDGGEGKVAIFSIWNALGASGPGIAQKFGGEGEGFQTVIPYDWKAGRKYRLRVFKSGESPKGTGWTATVRDETTGIVDVIGTITVPKKWGCLGDWSVTWTERYTGPEIRHCGDVGHAAALFEEPTANDGEVRPESRHSHLADPVNCPNSKIRDRGNSVVQEMGMP